MRFLRDNPEYWHGRAEEVRTIGEIMTDPEARRILFEDAPQFLRVSRMSAAVMSHSDRDNLTSAADAICRWSFVSWSA